MIALEIAMAFKAMKPPALTPALGDVIDRMRMMT